jgi:hypothetical protein
LDVPESASQSPADEIRTAELRGPIQSLCAFRAVMCYLASGDSESWRKTAHGDRPHFELA